MSATKRRGLPRVLLLDDEANQRHLLAEFLKTPGVEFVLCGEREAAESIVDVNPFDLIISDLEVSEIGGLEGMYLIRHVATHFPDTKLVIYSGHGGVEYVQELGKLLGAHAVLKKGPDLAKLKEFMPKVPKGVTAEAKVIEVEPLGKILAAHDVRSVFQPIVTLSGNGKPYAAGAVEALSRGPMGSYLGNPEVLFRYAARKEKLFEMDMVCIGRALFSMKTLPEDVIVFLNLQPRSLSHPEFAADLNKRIEEAGFKADRFVLEMTEQHTIVNPRALRKALDKLREKGFRVALDDYGEGVANLHLVQDLKPDYLKISGYFCRDIHREPTKKAIVDSTVDMAKKLGLLTVMEQVEYAEELEVLKETGIDFAQGYYFAKPAPSEELVKGNPTDLVNLGKGK